MAVSIKCLLIEELKHCYSPVTGINIACAIKTSKGLYFGHNTEKSNYYFYHAEKEALKLMKQAGDESKIKTVYLASFGNVYKIRKIAPCENCYKSLFPKFDKYSKIVLYEPNSFDKRISLNYKQIVAAYSSEKFGQINGKELKEIIRDLKTKTLLNSKQRKFVAELRQFGLENNIEFYLTGSSSGRGQLAIIINKKRKRAADDMDLIAVSNNPKKAKKQFEKIISKHYNISSIKKIVFHRYSYPNNKKTKHLVQYYSKTKKIAEISFTNKILEGFVREQYYRNNWYYKVS